MKVPFLVLLALVVWTSATATSCNNEASGNGVLEFDLSEGATVLESCRDMKACALDCGKIIKGCAYKTAFFDIGELERKTYPDFVRDGKATSWERIAYDQVCVKRAFGKMGTKDFFGKIEKKISEFKTTEEGTKIVNVVVKFIAFFRGAAKKCKKNGKDWVSKLRNDLLSFKEEEFLTSPDSIAKYKRIEKPIIHAFIEFQKVNDDISSDKYCKCLNFENFIGATRRQSMSSSERNYFVGFQTRYLGLARKMRQTCEKMCGAKKNGIGGILRNAGRVIKNSFSSVGYAGKKESQKRKILKVVKYEIVKAFGGKVKKEKKSKGEKKEKKAAKKAGKGKKAKKTGSKAPKDKKQKGSKKSKSGKGKKAPRGGKGGKKTKGTKNGSKKSKSRKSGTKICVSAKKNKICVREGKKSITVTIKQ